MRALFGREEENESELMLVTTDGCIAYGTAVRVRAA